MDYYENERGYDGTEDTGDTYRRRKRHSIISAEYEETENYE